MKSLYLSIRGRGLLLLFPSALGSGSSDSPIPRERCQGCANRLVAGGYSVRVSSAVYRVDVSISQLCLAPDQQFKYRKQFNLVGDQSISLNAVNKFPSSSLPAINGAANCCVPPATEGRVGTEQGQRGGKLPPSASWLAGWLCLPSPGHSLMLRRSLP